MIEKSLISQSALAVDEKFEPISANQLSERVLMAMGDVFADDGIEYKEMSMPGSVMSSNSMDDLSSYDCDGNSVHRPAAISDNVHFNLSHVRIERDELDKTRTGIIERVDALAALVRVAVKTVRSTTRS